MNAPLDELFYQERESQDWNKFNEICQSVNSIDSEERLAKVYRELQFLISLGHASYAGKTKGSNIITQGLYSGAYASFFLMFNKECQARYEMQAWSVDDGAQIFDFWHQLDDENLKDVFQLYLPPIKLNHLIYIPMHDDVLTVDNIDDLQPLEYGNICNSIVEA